RLGIEDAALLEDPHHLGRAGGGVEHVFEHGLCDDTVDGAVSEGQGVGIADEVKVWSWQHVRLNTVEILPVEHGVGTKAALPPSQNDDERPLALRQQVAYPPEGAPAGD